MRIPNIFKFLSVLLLLALSATASAAQYKLGSGDVIRISVHGEPDLSFEEVRLTDAGTFTFPFIGEVDANGKTPGEVRNVLVEKLKDGYLIDPRVSVSVVNYREFYISGEVKLPGGYPYQPGLTLDRAIALAGGLTERASTKRMTIVRGSEGSRAEEKATMDTQVRPGDTINIDEGFF
ncbi:polysaccharide biosynthesis/export family protein [Stutzerimonas stutzeri]|uniref:Capsular biosynthesis protein n=1 Tax=Stutzerimonas stutzeri TaxID=316 RepID=A0A2N8SNZ5_STUST|nr:polysaccharide biosynthesis/export family protein [Stutzerimonas stutzeri]MCQ4248677.1 polysaccharide export protein [Stutzerimonas stutzeri]PNG04210.1 capsular biosynthesis protein [Stutzerimonas stutzeri]PNG11954.1 capsular biosynthesis protein [Stutzerimonas stutzeri]QUE74749.1 polysaccharide export protein [Stutzerimonas stutzeri]